MKKDTFVVVTTDHERRGVFGGILESKKRNENFNTWDVILSECRNCVYWSKETKGFMGLASIGPQKGSRISPAITKSEINGVTCIMEVSNAAQKIWESEPWD